MGAGNGKMKLTAKRDGKIIGFITWKHIGKPKHKLVELMRIEVLPKYRKQEIATGLFKRMLSKIKFRKLFLTCHASNYTAHIFYEKMGMRLETQLKNHYYDGEDEWVYSLFKKDLWKTK